MKYYVIVFGQPPTEDYDKYVCVPQSWVVGHDDNKIAFRYPKENVSSTKRRITMGENVSVNWPMYLETVLLETESLDDAKELAKISVKHYRGSKKYTLPDGETHEKHNPDPTHRPAIYKGSKVHEDVNNSTATNATLNSEGLLTLCSSLQTLVNEIKRQDGCFDKLNTEFHEFFNASLSNAATLKNLKSKLLMSGTDRVISYDTDNYTDGENSTQAQNKTAKSITKTRRSVRDGYKKRITWSLIESASSRETTPDPYDDGESGTDETYREASDVKNARKKRKQKTKAARKEGKSQSYARAVQRLQAGREDDVQDEVQEEVTAKRKCIRSVSLPPEYDENDSRWTLRYREMAPELEELTPGTGVYLHSKRFANCKKMATDEGELAKLLLLEIFSKNALLVCSFTGAKRAYGLDEMPTRPGLDENARNVLIDYVDDYCHEMGWPSHRYPNHLRMMIKNHLSNKVHAIHLKAQRLNTKMF